MTDLDVVEHVATLFQRTVQRHKQRNPQHKPSFSTTVKGASAVQMMRVVRPVLGARRQAQIDAALARPHNETVRWLRRGGPCAVEGCDRPGLKRTLCKSHYDAWWKARKRGRFSALMPRGPEPIEAHLDVPPSGHPGALPWLAGLLEGEGSFHTTGGYPVVKLTMCDRDIVTRVAELLGDTRVWDMTQDGDAERGWSPTWATGLAGARAADLMRTLRPLMGVRRGAAIDRALEVYDPVRLVSPPAQCVIDGCDRPHRSRGLCNTHYMKWSRDRGSGREARVKPLR